MVILLIIFIALIATVVLLGGEGENYGKGNTKSSQDKRFTMSDRNFFL